MELNDIYIVYSVDKEKWGQALYPDDPKVIEGVVIGWTEAENLVYYLRGKDNSKLYGCECWEIHRTADDYIKTLEKCEDE